MITGEDPDHIAAAIGHGHSLLPGAGLRSRRLATGYPQSDWSCNGLAHRAGRLPAKAVPGTWKQPGHASSALCAADSTALAAVKVGDRMTGRGAGAGRRHAGDAGELFFPVAPTACDHIAGSVREALRP
jgi:hypothetical protein